MNDVPPPGEFQLPEDWPQAADPDAAARLVERFAPLDPGGEVPPALLRCLGGNAPYLAELALRESAALRRLATHGPETIVREAMAALAVFPPTTPREPLAAALRWAKRVIALATAVADIGHIWRLERVTEALSNLADATLSLSVAHLLRAAHESGDIVLPFPEEPARGSGFAVLGMGKLGARELNYSSDVDLVLLHDPEAGIYRGDRPAAFFTRIARGLVALMETRDADGYVFRTDLRLRPDPSATPPCIALPAALSYYESMGQNWERAAMLKARPVAGDLDAGALFLDAIRPFIWRRHLDFAAVADIHAMKRRIDAHRHTGLGRQTDPVARIAGHNVKLGEGGIREIEFLAQTLQLVWGGRDPGLRNPATLQALGLLVRAGHLPRRTAGELAAAYRFLRQVEHRVQMVADRQTHSLPERPEAIGAFAIFMGYPDGAAFANALLRHLERVQHRYLQVFDQVPEPPDGPVTGLDFTGVGEPPPATLAALKDMGYNNPVSVFSAVQGWQSGRVRAMRSHRSRDLMAQVLPSLLTAFARQRQPDAAFARFDAFLGHLPAGVQLLSLFHRNTMLLDRIAAVLGAAPSLSEHLARTPGALDGLLMPEERPDPARMLRARLADARMLEDAIAIVRRTMREEDFSISVATLEGRLDADAAGLARAALADATLAALLPRALEDFSARSGSVRGGGLVVVLLGKAGGREMMAGSDLDLMLIYDHPESVTESHGARPMAASQWFIRAVQSFVAALTAPDASGPLYAIDMRLRPSGNKGPVAVSLRAFRRYHAAGGDAWTWERMALTRARVVAGPLALRKRVEAAIRAAIAEAGPAEKIRADAAAMRARIARDLPSHGAWDVKHRAGGQMEVEFIAQALQLIFPRAANATTREALANLRDIGALSADDAAMLIRADRAWRTVQGMLRITEGRAPGEILAEASTEALLHAAALAGVDAVDVAGLRATLNDLAREVRTAFVRLVGEIET